MVLERLGQWQCHVKYIWSRFCIGSEAARRSHFDWTTEQPTAASGTSLCFEDGSVHHTFQLGVAWDATIKAHKSQPKEQNSRREWINTLAAEGRLHITAQGLA